MTSNNAALRRHEDNLYVSGLGVIIMGIWNVLRPVLQMTFGSVSYVDFEGVDPSIAEFVAVITVFILIAFFLAFLGLHFFIGMNAMKAAKRQKHKKGYFVCAIVVLVFSTLSMVSYAESLKNLDSIDTTIAALLVDVTTLYIFFTVIRSTVKIRKLKQIQEQGQG